MVFNFKLLKYHVFMLSAYGMAIFRIVSGMLFICKGNAPGLILGLISVSYAVLLFVGLCANKANFLSLFMIIETVLGAVAVIFIIVLELIGDLSTSYEQILHALLIYIMTAPIMLGIVYMCFRILCENNDGHDVTIWSSLRGKKPHSNEKSLETSSLDTRVFLTSMQDKCIYQCSLSSIQLNFFDMPTQIAFNSLSTEFPLLLGTSTMENNCKYYFFQVVAYFFIVYRIVVGILLLKEGSVATLVIGIILICNGMGLVVGLCQKSSTFIAAFMLIETALFLAGSVFLILDYSQTLIDVPKKTLDTITAYVVSAPMMLCVAFICYKEPFGEERVDGMRFFSRISTYH